MKEDDKFCTGDIRDNCQREILEGCNKCPSYITFRICKCCGADSTCQPIGNDNLCHSCRVLEDWP